MQEGAILARRDRSEPELPESAWPLISIIVPVYNEYYHIEDVIKRILDASMPPATRREVIVIDDGSTDGTTDVLQNFSRTNEVRVFHAFVNGGKGRAIRAGLKFAKGEVIAIQDGDQEYDPADLARVVEPIIAGRAKVVYGSRFLGRMRNMRFPYWLVNKLLVLAVWLLYGKRITDEATAYKAFHRDVISKLSLGCKRFEFCPEVTAKVIRAGHRIQEVPISYSARTVTEGKKIRFLDAVEAFWTLIRFRFWRPR